MDYIERYQAHPNDARKIRKEKIIDMIRRLMIRGVTKGEDIQKQLHQVDPTLQISIRSIYRYKGIIIKRSRKQIEDKYGLAKTVEEVAYEIKETFEEVMRELWVQYHSNKPKTFKCDCGKVHTVALPPTPQQRIMALNSIRETVDKHAQRLQSLGLVNSAPVKHQFLDKDGNPTDPPELENKTKLAAEFLSFFQAKYQLPVGSNKEVRDAGKVIEADEVKQSQ